MTIKLNDNEPLKLNPSMQGRDKIQVLYETLKERILKNDDSRLVELNKILKTLTKLEEDELIEVVTMSVTRPGDILFS